MTYKIVKGVLNKEQIEDEDLLIIGSLKTDIIKCKSLIVVGYIIVRKLLMCENVLIIGHGRIYSMISKNILLIPTTGPLMITDLKTLELIIRSERYPVIVNEIEVIKGIISHGLIDKLKGKKLILAEKTRIRNLLDCVEMIFIDPLVSIENILCEPKHIIFRYELGDR